MTIIAELLRDAAHRAPDRDAITRGDERVTWGALANRASATARALAARGIGPRERVAILHETGIDALVAFWGAQLLGAETVDVPGHASPETIGRALAECRPKAAILDGTQARRLDRAVLPEVLFGSRSTGFEGPHALEDVDPSGAPVALPAVGPGDVALTVYTSGTSGLPKGVMLSHHNVLSNITAANTLAGLGEGESLLLVVPLYFIHGRMQLLTYAAIAGTLHLSAGFLFPERVLDELMKTRAAAISGVPYHFTTLMDRTTLATRRLPDLKRMLITGGALGFGALKRLAMMVPGVEIHTAYGMTEASPRVTYLGPREVLSRPHCAGRPLPGVSVEIVASDGGPVPRGGVGEVTVRGPNVMKGYVSGDEGRIDAEGRLRTGDLGRLDAEGYLYLAGRQSDLVKTAGERVFPREIEEVLDRHPDVMESAVLGVPDATLGERLVALVVTRAGRTLEAPALKTHALRWLPFVRAPREIHFVGALPKTASGKIDRAGLPAMAGLGRS